MAANLIRVRHLVASLLLGVLASCAAVPVQEMSDARQALQAAKEVGAESYARDDFDTARHLLRKAEEDLDMGFFERAQKNAKSAKHAAMQARDKALATSSTSSP